MGLAIFTGECPLGSLLTGNAKYFRSKLFFPFLIGFFNATGWSRITLGGEGQHVNPFQHSLYGKAKLRQTSNQCLAVS